jgi:hypothetical protein
MDTYTLVANRIADGRRLIDVLIQNEIPLTAVAWVKTSEEGDWYLYIATARADKIGPARTYGEIYEALGSLRGTSISVSDVKLVSGDNPITKDILAIRERYPGTSPTRSRRNQLGQVAVEEVYIYPVGTTSQVLTTLGEPIPEILTDFRQGVGPDEYVEIPYLKPQTAPDEDTLQNWAILRLKRKEVRTLEVYTGFQTIEGRTFATVAKISIVDDGVVGVGYRVEEIKR